MKFGEKYFASHYKKQFKINCFKRLAYQSYVRYLFKLRQGTLLDCGCGIGNFLRFAEQKFITMGFDISEYAILQAESYTKSSKLWISSTLKKIPLENETVDVVTAFDIVEHFTEHEIFFREVNRVLCSEGIFLIRTPNLNAWALKKKGSNWYVYRDETHISLKQKEYWLYLLYNTGFNVISVGTDLVWDTPVFTSIPHLVQKIIFKGSKFISQLYSPFAHVDWGDNLIIVCRKTQ